MDIMASPRKRRRDPNEEIAEDNVHSSPTPVFTTSSSSSFEHCDNNLSSQLNGNETFHSPKRSKVGDILSLNAFLSVFNVNNENGPQFANSSEYLQSLSGYQNIKTMLTEPTEIVQQANTYLKTVFRDNKPINNHVYQHQPQVTANFPNRKKSINVKFSEEQEQQEPVEDISHFEYTSSKDYENKKIFAKIIGENMSLLSSTTSSITTNTTMCETEVETEETSEPVIYPSQLDKLDSTVYILREVMWSLAIFVTVSFIVILSFSQLMIILPIVLIINLWRLLGVQFKGININLLGVFAVVCFAYYFYLNYNKNLL